MTRLLRQRAHAGSTRPQLVVLGGSLLVMCAGLLSLAQSDALAATGHRISDLQDRRIVALEQRTDALVAWSAATDPRRLAQRAAALGFVAPEAVTRVTVPGIEPADALAQGVSPASPLAIVLRRSEPNADASSDRVARFLDAHARPASAAEERQDGAAP
jgi:hypothetical protein